MMMMMGAIRGGTVLAVVVAVAVACLLIVEPVVDAALFGGGRRKRALHPQNHATTAASSRSWSILPIGGDEPPVTISVEQDDRLQAAFTPRRQSPPKRHRLSTLRNEQDVFKLSKSKLFRFRQRWSRRQKDYSRRLDMAEKNDRGTLLTLQRPTRERVAQWFGINELRPPRFNHDRVGMTNPCLGIYCKPSFFDNYQLKSPAIHKDDDDATLRERLVSLVRRRWRTEHGESPPPVPTAIPASVDKAWWPETALKGATCENKRGWHTRTYRMRVGKGWDCYQRVRDAALRWEFSGNRQGMLPVGQQQQQRRLRRGGRRRYAVLPLQESEESKGEASFLQIWSGPGKRLVTFARSSSLLYAVNPVAVVYDLVDVAGHGGCTFSSTAYATCQGHWLRGEERVTVIVRQQPLLEPYVDVEICSCSQPIAQPAKVMWPWMGRRMQDEFFRQQLKCLQHVAAEASTQKGQQQALVW